MDYLTTAAAPAIGLLFAFILVLLTYLLPTKTGNILLPPPGPTNLPFIGSLHLLVGNQPHKSLANLAKKHGPIMSLKLGQITTVVISSSDIAKEVIQKHDLAVSGRTIPNAIHAHDHYKYSVVWLPPLNSRWRSLRKVLNSNIFSVKRLDANQHLRSKKVQELIDYCRKNSETGQAVDIGRAVFRTTLNLLSNTIFSKDLTDPFSDSAKEFRELVCNVMMEAGKPNLVDFFPILEKLDPQGIRQRLTVHFGNILHLFRGLIDERLSSVISQGAAMGDVLDVLLTASQQTPHEIDRKHIEHLCLDLFVAGTDTTSNTVEWAMTELLKNPDKMEKTKAEIAQVIGKGKVIQDADVAHLPYLQCVVKESLRIHPPGPFIVRKLEQQVDVCGYNIPKGTQLIFNIWAFGQDGTIWKDSMSIFKPERFLESEIDIRGQNFELIPFGGGRRICPGLPLAVRMVHVVLGSLLNCFDWKLECGIAPEDLDMEEKLGLTLQKASPLLVVPIPLL